MTHSNDKHVWKDAQHYYKHQRSANQTHNEITSHTCENACYKKDNPSTVLVHYTLLAKIYLMIMPLK